jgi:hypothetical protein
MIIQQAVPIKIEDAVVWMMKTAVSTQNVKTFFNWCKLSSSRLKKMPANFMGCEGGVRRQIQIKFT